MTLSTPEQLSAPPRPRRSYGGDSALWVGMLLGFAAALVLGVALGQRPGGAMLALVVLAAGLFVAAIALLALGLAYRRLTYTLDHDVLTIGWFGERFVIPYAAIEGIYTGQRLVGQAAPTTPCWPGIYVGWGRAKGLGRLRFFATSQDPADLTLITVPGMGVVLSARDPQSFRATLIQRARQSVDEETPVPALGLVREPARTAPWSALHDRWALWFGGVGLLLLLGVLAAISFEFPRLPDQVPLRFDALGQPSQVGFRGDLLDLPLAGSFVLLVNWALGVWLHPRSAPLARLLWIGGALVQGILLVATIRLLQ